jgi:hypothetical protein
MREKLWRSHLPAAVPTAGAFDLAELARRYQLSGGYIRNATLRAAFLAAEEHVPLTQDHLERAIKAELRELGHAADPAYPASGGAAKLQDDQRELAGLDPSAAPTTE